jgi:hypothetical protein
MKTSKTIMLAAIFSIVCAGVWIAGGRASHAGNTWGSVTGQEVPKAVVKTQTGTTTGQASATGSYNQNGQASHGNNSGRNSNTNPKVTLPTHTSPPPPTVSMHTR